jgi:CubicO group peptidase (beta-lactamase class C family)
MLRNDKQPIPRSPLVAHARVRAPRKDKLMRSILRLTAFLMLPLLLVRAQTPTLTAADIESFLDGVMPLQLAREDIAGAVIAVVKDGKILFVKGYGYSDVAKRTPVSPEATLFRPGSISKLFTWTAVMQLVEQGKLDLDSDVNRYLDFKIPDTYPKPITLRNIMTHTSGFEETDKELFLPDVKDLKPLDDYLKTHLPQRIFPPGVTPAYSNYATCVAGYIVQRVSGQPYDDYIESHILKPLGMAHTSFRQPLPDALKPLLSNGYNVASKPAKPFEVVQPWPAGSSSVSANDITRFMIAHLQDGQFESVQILRPETAQLMHSRQFENNPRLNGMALGFYEETRNGHRIIGHGGDTICFHSDLHLIPDAGLGFFMSYNSAGKGEISPRSAVWNQFLDRYFPYTPPAATMVPNSEDVRMVSGDYIISRRSQTTILSLLTLLGELKVSQNTDGTISASAFKELSGQPKHFREIAPLLFREVNGQSLLGFKRDDSGRLVMAIDFPFMVFQKARWFESSLFNMIILIGSLSVFALTLLLWPVAALVRRHYGRKLDLSPAERRWRLLVRMVCAVDLAFVLAFLAALSGASDDPSKLNRGLDPVLHIVELIGFVGVLGTLAALYNSSRFWNYRDRWWWAKIHHAGIALACLGFSWFVLHWHVLHWGLNY